MKRTAIACLILSTVAIGCAQPAPETDGQPGASTDTQSAETGGQEKAEFLFVQESEGVTADGETMTMTGVEPQVLFFTDRPERLAGYLTIDEFLSAVSEGPDSFAKDPPNATLASLEGDEFVDVVVELTQRPRYEDDNLVFKIEVIQGELPLAGGPSALFIDTIGRPLSPGSVAGAHRRHRRRAVRRHQP
ncbi:MAG: hypothetical protein WBI00_01065 [Thermoanaerobaculia bacterium]